MINKAIIKAILATASKENKDCVLNELLNHISLNYDYNDIKAGHILEMLCGSSIIEAEDINIDFIKEHLNLLMYKHEDYIIDVLGVENIDNIDGYAVIKYKYIEKVNEFRDDITPTETRCNVSFIDNPEILLKKS